MIIKTFKYSEFPKTQRYWAIEKFSLGRINLLVGKNAIGKTRTINVVKGLARIILGELGINIISGYNEVCFKKGNEEIRYNLNIESFKIKKEKLEINNKVFLDRKLGGKGKIYASQLDDMIDFQAPENVVACLTRRDAIQHPYFEDLHEWANSVDHYLFGSQLGKGVVSIRSKDAATPDKEIKNTNRVVKIFLNGIKKYRDSLKDAIIKDMNSIGYKINDIGVQKLPSVVLPSHLTGYPVGIYVQEHNLKCKTHQMEMSQGMFRALSLIIQINISQLAKAHSCILIDDIGEGLDFERATSLIRLLIDKAEDSSFQLIMSTNDRFVMNAVSLKYWQVVLRDGETCNIINYENSKKIFDDFKFAGLANFDFFSTEFYSSGLSK